MQDWKRVGKVAAGFVAVVGAAAVIAPRAGYTRDPGTDVNVVNPATAPALVRDVDSAVLNPFQRRERFDLGSRTATVAKVVHVPVGRHLVIEYVSEDETLNRTLPSGRDFGV